MPDTGVVLPGTVVTIDTESGGDTDWSNPNNIKASDNADATVTLGATDISFLLVAKNFGLSIPAGATILGFEVFLEGRRSAGGASFSSEIWLDPLSTGGQPTQSDAYPITWPTSESTQTFGAADDLWGIGWTPAQVNGEDFGVMLYVVGDLSGSTTHNIDSISIRVTYSEAGGGAPVAVVSQIVGL